MRINVYSQELTNEVVHLVKEGAEGEAYHAAQLMLHSSLMLHHPPMDDDRSAITFWLPRSGHRREEMAQAFEAIARIFREPSPATFVDKLDSKEDPLAEPGVTPFTLVDYQRERAALERQFFTSYGTHAEDIDIAIQRGVLPCNDFLVEEWAALQALAPYVVPDEEKEQPAPATHNPAKIACLITEAHIDRSITIIGDLADQLEAVQGGLTAPMAQVDQTDPQCPIGTALTRAGLVCSSGPASTGAVPWDEAWWDEHTVVRLVVTCLNEHGAWVLFSTPGGGIDWVAKTPRQAEHQLAHVRERWPDGTYEIREARFWRDVNGEAAGPVHLMLDDPSGPEVRVGFIPTAAERILLGRMHDGAPPVHVGDLMRRLVKRILSTGCPVQSNECSIRGMCTNKCGELNRCAVNPGTGTWACPCCSSSIKQEASEVRDLEADRREEQPEEEA